MCGIAGILNFNRSKVLHDDLQKITDVIAHRGPDGEGHWINENKNVGFGHRRLSIIDLTDSGKQPMHYASGRYTITFNGEIYNYIELRELLKTKGYIFLSNSDTEVLLAMYDWKKEHCLSFLDGMFAFAIWDENEQSLFCARDRFGEKPFYYSLENGKEFCFASEMKALWAHGISKENDNKVLDNYLKTGSAIFAEDATKTFYAKIKQLDSGHYLIINNKMELLTKCYYHLDHIQLNKNIKLTDAIEEFKQLFLESIKLRLRSDVSVGSSLSGGLDSSSIVMLIDSLKDSMINQHTFSARFDGFVRDEGVQMHQVLNKCKNVVPHEVWPQEQEFQEIIDKIIFHQEEPFGSSSVFAQWKVMELAKKNGTVVLLDGQGADEYLAGYLPFYGLYFKQLFFTNKKKYQYEKAAYFKLRGIEGTSFESEETLRMKIGRLKRSMMNQKMPYDETSLSKELKRQTLSVGLKELLRYADRNSMAHSREVRLPFLSHKLVEFVNSLPDDFKLFEGWTKYILRRSMEDVLPKEITWRIDKVGYETPQNNWLANEFWIEKIANGKKKYAQFNSSKTRLISDWECIMLDKYLN